MTGEAFARATTAARNRFEAGLTRPLTRQAGHEHHRLTTLLGVPGGPSVRARMLEALATEERLPTRRTPSRDTILENLNRCIANFLEDWVCPRRALSHLHGIIEPRPVPPP